MEVLQRGKAELLVKNPGQQKLEVRERQKVELRIRKKEAEKLREIGNTKYRIRDRLGGILKMRSNNCRFFGMLSASVSLGVLGLFYGEEGGRHSSIYPFILSFLTLAHPSFPVLDTDTYLKRIFCY